MKTKKEIVAAWVERLNCINRPQELGQITDHIGVGNTAYAWLDDVKPWYEFKMLQRHVKAVGFKKAAKFVLKRYPKETSLWKYVLIEKEVQRLESIYFTDCTPVRCPYCKMPL